MRVFSHLLGCKMVMIMVQHHSKMGAWLKPESREVDNLFRVGTVIDTHQSSKVEFYLGFEPTWMWGQQQGRGLFFMYGSLEYVIFTSCNLRPLRVISRGQSALFCRRKPLFALTPEPTNQPLHNDYQYGLYGTSNNVNGGAQNDLHVLRLQMAEHMR